MQTALFAPRRAVACVLSNFPSVHSLAAWALQRQPRHDSGVGGWVTSLWFNASEPSMVLAGSTSHQIGRPGRVRPVSFLMFKNRAFPLSKPIAAACVAAFVSLIFVSAACANNTLSFDFESPGQWSGNFRTLNAVGTGTMAQTTVSGTGLFRVDSTSGSQAAVFLFDQTPADTKAQTDSGFAPTGNISVSFDARTSVNGTSFSVFFVNPANFNDNVVAILNINGGGTLDQMRFFKDCNTNSATLGGTQAGGGNYNVGVDQGATWVRCTVTLSLAGTTPTLTMNCGGQTATSTFVTGDFPWATRTLLGLRFYDNSTASSSVDIDNLTIVSPSAPDNPPGPPPPNAAPVFPAQSDRTVGATIPMQVNNAATDDATQTLTYQLTTAPSGASISSTGVITWTPTMADISTTPYTFTTLVTDNGSPTLTSTNSFQVTVLGSFLHRNGYSQWVSIPLITESSRNAGNTGGEGCQVVEALTCDSTGNVLIATTDVGGLLRSTNAGASWTPINVTYTPRGANAVGIDPRNANRVIVAGSNGGQTDYAGSHGLYLSTNQGDTWTKVLSNTNLATKQFRDQIAYDPTSYSSTLGYTQTIYWSSPTSTGTLYKSTDGGSTWAAVTSTILSGTALNFGNSILKVDSSGVLYAGNSTGIYKSVDQGLTFTLIVDNVIKGMDQVNPATIYYNTSTAVFTYDVATGVSTQLAATGLPTGKLTYIKVSPVDQTRMSIFAGDFNPICYSLDGGATWARSVHDNTYSFIPDNSNQNGKAAAWHPTIANTVYGFSWGFLIKSTNGGANYKWSNNGYTGVMQSGYFNFNVTDPNLLLLTSQDYNSALTVNGGYTWKYLNVSKTGWGGYNYGGYAISSGATGRMFAGHADSWGGARTLRVSMNGGSTWTALAITGNSSDAACGDPADTNYAYWDQWRTTNGMATGTAADWVEMVGCTGVHTYNPVTKELYGRNGSTVVTSSDHGATWTTVATFPGTVADIAIDHTRNRLYVTTTARKLYQHDINVSGVIEITGRLPADQRNIRGANTIAVDPVNPDVLYEGEHADIYMTSVAVARSVDAGVTWTNLSKKTGDTGPDGGHEVQCVRVHPGNRYLYAGGQCFGIWSYAPPVSAARVFEAETMTVAAQANATPGTFASTGSSGGACLDLGTAASGASVTLELPNCKAATYKLAYSYRKTGNPNGPGVFQVSYSENVAGPFTNIGGTVNFYDASGPFVSATTPGNITFATPGTKYLRFTAVGLSGGTTYTGKVDVVSLTDLTSREIESLNIGATSGDALTFTKDAELSGGTGRTFNADAVGDFVSYTIPNVEAGTYNLKLAVTTSGGAGTFQASVDGVDLGSPVNAYSPVTGYTLVNLGNRYFANSGAKTLRLRVTGKQADSTGYALSFDYVQITPAASTDNTPPTAPADLTLTGLTATTVSLSWTASTDNTGVAGYYVYRNNVQVGTTAATTFTDTGLTAGASYSYHVKAFDAFNNVSEQSNTVIPTDTEPPSAPTYLTVTSMTATSISLSWTASTDNAAVAGYDVFRNNVQVGSTALTTYTDSNLTAGGTYTYFLKAYDASGNISAASSGVVFSPLWQDALETGATGWTHAAETGSDGWVLTTAQSHSTTSSYFSPGPASVSDSSLVSPAITIPANATTLQLSFWHNYTFQSGVDGGVLEFSLDNGLWFDAVSSGSGGAFTNGGYNATLTSTGGNPNNRNPLVASGSRPGWSGTSNGWTQTTVSITTSNYAGKSLRVRWRLGTNSNTASAGWYVDDIAILLGGTAANLAPTITQAVAAAPATVSANQTTLTALASDDGGAGALTYTWSVNDDATAPITFSQNGNNAANTTTATFSKAGLFTFTVTALDAGGLTATSSVQVQVNQTLTDVSVTPLTATVGAGDSLSFTATAHDQFGDTLEVPPAFIWSASGGTVSQTGHYTAGSVPGDTYTVMAASADVTGGASVIVTGQTYSSWQAENFTAGEISSGLAEDKADIDGDGFVNLVEYALGSDPHTRSPELTAAILPDGNMENRLTLSFTRPRALPAVSYAVEVSPNLSTWDTITSYEIISTETTETVTARDPVPADGAQQRFIRLRVTRQPW